MRLKGFGFFIVSIILGVITVLGVWYLLRGLSNAQPAPYDPSPLAQALQTQKITFTQKSEAAFRWIELKSGTGDWITSDGTNLKDYKLDVNSVQILVILARGQGPSLASALFTFLKREALLEKTILLSPSDGLIKDMRFLNKEDPHLITSGNGQAFMVRFIGLRQIGLSNFPSTDFDVAWVDPTITTSDTRRIADIFISKKIPTLIGPITAEQAHQYPEGAQLLIQ